MPNIYGVSYQRLLISQTNRSLSFTSQDEFLMEAEGYSFGGALFQDGHQPELFIKESIEGLYLPEC